MPIEGIYYPKALTPAEWQKRKGAIAKIAGRTGIGELLTSISQTYKRLDGSKLSPREIPQQKKDLIEKYFKIAESYHKAKVEPLRKDIHKLRELARKTAVKWKKSRTIPSSARKVAETLVKEAGVFEQKLKHDSKEFSEIWSKYQEMLKRCEADAGDDETDDQLLDPVFLKKLVKRVARKPNVYRFGFGLEAKSEDCLLVFRKKGPPKALGMFIKKTGVKRITWGMASADPEDTSILVLTLEGRQLAGMAKKVKKLLRERKLIPFKQVRLEMDGDEVEDLPDIQGEPIGKDAVAGLEKLMARLQGTFDQLCDVMEATAPDAKLESLREMARKVNKAFEVTCTTSSSKREANLQTLIEKQRELIRSAQKLANESKQAHARYLKEQEHVPGIRNALVQLEKEKSPTVAKLKPLVNKLEQHITRKKWDAAVTAIQALGKLEQVSVSLKLREVEKLQKQVVKFAQKLGDTFTEEAKGYTDEESSKQAEHLKKLGKGLEAIDRMIAKAKPLIKKGRHAEAEKALHQVETILKQVWSSELSSEYARSRKAINKLVETGMLPDAELIDELKKDESQIKGRDDLEGPDQKLDQMKDYIQQVQAYEKDYPAANEKVRKRCEAVKKECAKIRKIRGVPKTLRQALEKRIKAAETLVASPSLQAQEGAGHILDEIERDVADVVKNAKTAFEKVKKDLKAGQAIVGSKGLKSIMPLTQAHLDKTGKELEKEVFSLLPEQALARVEEWHKSAETAAADMKWWKMQSTLLKKQIPIIDKVMKGLDTQVKKQKLGKKYEGSLVPRVADTKKMVKQALKTENRGLLQSAWDSLNEIREQAEKYLSDPKEITALKADQKAVQDELAREAEFPKQWKRMYTERFLKEVAYVQKLVKKVNGDNDAVSQAVKLGKQANKSAKKKQYEAALRKLQLARDELARLSLNPEGSRVTAKKNVEKIAKRWNQAVAQLQKNVDGFTRELVQHCDTANLDAKVAAAVKKSVPRVTKQFQEGVFDKPLQMISNDEVTERERKANREAALRMVRKYQDILNRDPLTQHLVYNPFKSRSGMFTPLYHTLRDLDLNLRRCL